MHMDAQTGWLAALLSALAHPCGALHLRCCGVTPAAFEGCAAYLAGTTQLASVQCVSTGGQATLAPALEVLIRQTPQLRELRVIGGSGCPWYGSLGAGVPAAVPTLQHLTSLALVGIQLPHLDGVLDGMPGAGVLALPTIVHWCCTLRSLTVLRASQHAPVAASQLIRRLAPAVQALSSWSCKGTGSGSCLQR